MVNDPLKDLLPVFHWQISNQQKGQKGKIQDSITFCEMRSTRESKEQANQVNKGLGVWTKGKQTMFRLPPGIAAEKNVQKIPFSFLAQPNENCSLL